VQHAEGGPIYLHQLDGTATSLFDAPEATEYYKTTLENVRMKVRHSYKHTKICVLTNMMLLGSDGSGNAKSVNCSS